MSSAEATLAMLSSALSRCYNLRVENERLRRRIAELEAELRNRPRLPTYEEATSGETIIISAISKSLLASLVNCN